jgi:tryptophan synthase alpha chain
MKLEIRTDRIRAAGRKALVPYFTAGYPDQATFLKLLAAASDAGCGVIEIGVPFSDPVADGPVIQQTGHAALTAGMTLRRTLELTAEHRSAHDTSPVLMSYLNPILSLGVDVFADTAATAGAAGVILPDVPYEESAELRATLGCRGLRLIDLVAPTSGAERLDVIAGGAEGFLYLVSLTGVTGSALDTGGGLMDFIAGVRRRTSTPCYVGFGVGTPDHVRALSPVCDGVVIGSALMRLVRDADGPDQAVEAVRRFLFEMNEALHECSEGTPR